jgi:hypothetical protein
MLSNATSGYFGGTVSAAGGYELAPGVKVIDSNGMLSNVTSGCFGGTVSAAGGYELAPGVQVIDNNGMLSNVTSGCFGGVVSATGGIFANGACTIGSNGEVSTTCVSRTCPTVTDVPHPVLASPSRLVLAALEGTGASIVSCGRATVPTGDSATSVDIDAALGIEAGTYASIVSQVDPVLVLLGNNSTFAFVNGTVAFAPLINGGAPSLSSTQLVITCSDTSGPSVDWLIIGSRLLTSWSNVRVSPEGRLVAQY